MRGSAPGERRGGRKAGTANKKRSEKIAEIAASGLMPLDYMLQVLRNEEEEPARRSWAANAAAPYLHPKLSQVELGNKQGEKFVVQLLPSDDD